MKYNIENQVRGTRIISGDEAKDRRNVLNRLIEQVEVQGFNEIILPNLEQSIIYEDKAGKEVLNQMYVFPDKKGRSLCLRPEGTATIQKIADKYYPNQKDVKFWYFTPCYRYERPQAGRYREFYQFGVEWINPSVENVEQILQLLALKLITSIGVNSSQVKCITQVARGLAYYTSKGFEISAEELGSQKQICGGGEYKQGIGFGLGFDRLMLLKRN
tara:strand:- start:800 stop:1447 length:648 start_codon:yes stop_codon:yes gene_type:complete